MSHSDEGLPGKQFSTTMGLVELPHCANAVCDHPRPSRTPSRSPNHWVRVKNRRMLATLSPSFPAELIDGGGMRRGPEGRIPCLVVSVRWLDTLTIVACTLAKLGEPKSP